MKTIKLSKIKIGPIRQAVLPEGFILRVQKLKEVLKEVETTSLETTISNFQRDLHPENELAIWEAIAQYYASMTKGNPKLTLPEKKKAFGDILRASLG